MAGAPGAPRGAPKFGSSSASFVRMQPWPLCCVNHFFGQHIFYIKMYYLRGSFEHALYQLNEGRGSLTINHEPREIMYTLGEKCIKHSAFAGQGGLLGLDVETSTIDSPDCFSYK